MGGGPADKVVRRMGGRVATAVWAIVWFAGLLAAARPASAHPAPFSYLDVVFPQGGIEGKPVLHLIAAAHQLGITPPERLLENDVAASTREQLGAILKPRITFRTDHRLDVQ